MTCEKTAIPTCQEVFELLGDWCEGKLPAPAEQPYEQHLKLCPPCASIASTYQALSRIATSALETTMPEEARERLRRAVAARMCGRR
jgi:anti-sigma factor RsiW